MRKKEKGKGFLTIEEETMGINFGQARGREFEGKGEKRDGKLIRDREKIKLIF